MVAQLQEKLEQQTFGEGEKTFTKQTCIFVETMPETEYPNTVAIDFSGDNLMLASAMDVGKTYAVNFSISCKKTDKGGLFNTIRGWKIHEVATQPQEETDVPF